MAKGRVFIPEQNSKDDILWYIVELREEGFGAMADLLLDYSLEKGLI